MTEIWFTARERFGPFSGDSWNAYVAWAKLPQLREVISLDIVLCPDLITQLHDEDWAYNVQQDFCISYFHDLEYLIRRIGRRPANILAILREPAVDPQESLSEPGFVFLGYDLIGIDSGISALTNCGGFPLAFTVADLSAVGLIEQFERGRAIQALLRQHYPDEPHADCELWAIWKVVAS